MEEMPETNGNGWKLACGMLAMFIIGNGTNFLFNGIHNVTREDFERAQQITENRLSIQDDHLQLIEKEMSNLVGQLQARHEIERLP